MQGNILLRIVIFILRWAFFFTGAGMLFAGDIIGGILILGISYYMFRGIN
jgi:hypothetical protein